MFELNGKSYYTVEGASERLGISRSSLCRELRKKAIRVLKHPRGNLFLQEWLDEWIERKTFSPNKRDLKL